MKNALIFTTCKWFITRMHTDLNYLKIVQFGRGMTFVVVASMPVVRYSDRKSFFGRVHEYSVVLHKDHGDWRL